MFKSKQRPIVVTQFEHAKLSGAIASLWGNQDFDRPALDFDSFVKGVTYHDWGYGLIDNYPIGEGSEAEWIKVQQRGVEVQTFDDPIAAIVSKLHIRRLADRQDKPERQELVALIDAQVQERLPESGHSLEEFMWADRITNLCDMVAFDFCFERYASRSMGVYKKLGGKETTELVFEIKPNGDIIFSPWPFSVPDYAGFIMAYEQEGYPERLEPLILNYRFLQAG